MYISTNSIENNNVLNLMGRLHCITFQVQLNVFTTASSIQQTLGSPKTTVTAKFVIVTHGHNLLIVSALTGV